MLKDLGLLAMRLSTGLTLAVHGYTKLFGGPEKPPPEPLKKALGPNFTQAVEEGGPANFSGALSQMGVPSPQAAAYASGMAEFGGGLALALGFKTRLAALAVILNLAVAIKKVHWANGFYGGAGFEYPLALLSSALGLFLTGPGRLSLDGERRKPRKTSPSDDDEPNVV